MMDSNSAMMRASIRSLLRNLGLLPAALRFRSFIRKKQELRSSRWKDRRFVQFERRYGDLIRYRLDGADNDLKKVLVFGSGFPETEAELGLIKALELAGYVPVVVIHRSQAIEQKYYGLTVKEVLFWDDFMDAPNFAVSQAIIDQHKSVQALLQFSYEDARVGLFAVSTTLRNLRLGSLNLDVADERRSLVERLASSMSHATAAQRIARKVQPQLALFVDGVYTPEGELVDVCLAKGIDAISWDVAHKSNTLMFKRYNLGNRDQHPWSLSPESWRILREMEWTDTHREQIQQELYGSYSSGDWYSTHGTQFNKRILDATTLRRELGLDPRKKTAFIFPHILWDASLNWGKDLFRDYEEWLIETVRGACTNDHVNWVIKIHPAHVGKNVVEGYRGEPAEVVVLRKHIGDLPPHVIFIPADSSISTFGLFTVMDYCLTVRGTVGIEAARLGIPALTAGTVRYSNMGFTIDSKSREEYLERVASIQEIPRLSQEQQELADRFAYGLFILRPFPLETFTLEYRDDKNFLSNIEIKIKAENEWYSAPDLRAFAKWVVDSRQSDFLLPLPQTQVESPL